MSTSRSSSEALRACSFFLQVVLTSSVVAKRDVTFGHNHQCHVDFDPTMLSCCRKIQSLLIPSLLSQALSGS